MKRSLFVLGSLATVVSAQAVVVYQNDFQSNANGFSNGPLTLAPNASTQFLGRFSNDTTTLTLNGLAAHTDITLSLDVYIIHSWDGNGGSGNGPDTLRFAADGTDLLNANFSNWSSPMQSYSDATPLGGGPFAFRTDNDGLTTLGYNDFFGTDTLYRMSFTFSHTASNLVLDFQGLGLQGVGDESWGIDNVVVSATPVPEPMTLSALALGGMALLRRRRK